MARCLLLILYVKLYHMIYNQTEITATTTKISQAVNDKRLHEAFIQLRHLSSQLGDWHITEDIDSLEADYRLMLDYTVRGIDDPDRDNVYASIVSRILVLTDTITHRLKKSSAPEMYYCTLRYEALQKGETLQSLVDRYRKVVSDLSFAGMMSYSGTATDNITRLSGEAVELERRIFNRIWVMYPLSHESVALITSLLDKNNVFSQHFRVIVLSSLLLGLTQYYDEERLNILLDSYQQEHGTQTGTIALCAALIAMFMHRDRIVSVKISQRVASLRETTDWHKDIRTIFMQLLKSRDTERINRKFNEEVLPELQKLKPDMARRLNTMNLDLGSMDNNPEWERIMDESGITDKLKQMQEMLEDGSDIFMSAFASLKSIPFFSEPVNWFTPYRASHPELSGLDDSISSICRLIESSPVLCDSDKYSVALAMKNMPTQQRELIRTQLDSQAMTSMELQSMSIADSLKDTQREANNYICSVYRFFKLFRRRSDFNDPFVGPLDLLSIPLLQTDFCDTEMLRLVAEFYFKRKYYSNAFNTYALLEKEIGADCPTYQKMGFCMQKQSDFTEALKWYSKARLLDGKNLWTLKRMSACYSASGQTDKALECLTIISEQRPDDHDISTNIGHCLLELGRPSEALKYYFKVEYLDAHNTKVLRPIAWCSFLVGNYSQSLNYYNKILATQPKYSDYLNLGHLYLAMGNIAEAIQYYRQSIDEIGKDRFISDFKADINVLTSAGVDSKLPNLIIDAVEYL